MKRTARWDRRTLLRGLVALGAAGATRVAGACEVQALTLTVVHPWTRATGPNATTAAVCMRFVDVVEADRLVGASTPVASGAELGGTDSPVLDYVIPAGRDTEFHERGVHVRLVGLRQPLQMGTQFPLTLTFEKAGEVQTSLTVDFVFG